MSKLWSRPSADEATAANKITSRGEVIGTSGPEIWTGIASMGPTPPRRSTSPPPPQGRWPHRVPERAADDLVPFHFHHSTPGEALSQIGFRAKMPPAS